MKKNTPSPLSPKNAYRVVIDFESTPGRTWEQAFVWGSMDLDDLRELATREAAKLREMHPNSRVAVSITHNRAQFPSFDWEDIEHYTLGERRGGAREGAGRKAKADARVTLSARVAPATLAALRERAEREGIGIGELLDALAK